MARAEARDGASQGMLIPVTLDLAATEATLLRRHLDVLNALGFGLEEFGGNSFMVTAVPPHFPQDNVAGQIREILDDLRDSSGQGRRLDEDQIATAACKAAVKAHDPLKAAEIQQLMVQLAGSELPYTCPHGRPTMIAISYAELEKRFGRRH
jgi:DNA mismatch repair protein MutL